MARGYWSTLILLVLSLLGMFRLASGLTLLAEYELYLLIIGTLLTVGAVVGIAHHSMLGWLLAGVLFAAGIVNALAIYIWGTPDSLTLVLTLLVTIAGLVVTLRHSHHGPAERHVETYDVVEVEAARRKASKRKSTRKASKRKTKRKSTRKSSKRKTRRKRR